VTIKDVSDRLARDQFAFYFGGDGSIPADLLGDFLRRAAAISRRNGIELEVVGIEPGSLSVVLKTIKKATKRIQGEFGKAPLATVAAVAALVSAMNGDDQTPIQQAGAKIVIDGKADNIYIVTSDHAHIVMDRNRASTIAERERQKKSRLLPRGVIAEIIDEGISGTLSGVVLSVHGVLHFRPDNRNFLVPIDTSSPAAPQLYEGRFQMRADLRLLEGQPDSLVVYRARPD
jgi:hypothetical protein